MRMFKKKLTAKLATSLPHNYNSRFPRQKSMDWIFIVIPEFNELTVSNSESFYQLVGDSLM